MALIAYHQQGSDTKAHCTLDTFVACFSLSWLRSIERCSLEKQDRSGNPGTGSQNQRVRECNMMWGADFKVPPPMFSGRNDDWPVWSARFGAYAALASVLEVAEAQTAPISMVGATPEASRLDKIIYAVLLTKTEGTACSNVHLTQRGAGAEAWRLLRAEYAGSSGARLGNMVREVVCPRSAGEDFLTSLIEWEVKVAASEVASGDKISEAVIVATIMDHAPDAVKSMLRFSPLEQRRSVDALKLRIRESSCATPGLFQGSMPMQVGAVSDGGRGKKGKSKSTGDEGKGKGKRTRTKHKGNNGDKNKERDDWNTGQRQPKFQGNCSHCLKWGHKRADCRTRLAQQKNGAVAGVQEPESEAEDVKQHSGVTSTVEDVDMASSSWCFASLITPRGPAGTLLVDSGADDHICNPDSAKEFPLKKIAGVTLRDVQSNPLSHHGTRHVNLSVGTPGQRANIDFQIADTSDNILGLGKLLRNWICVQLEGRE